MTLTILVFVEIIIIEIEKKINGLESLWIHLKKKRAKWKVHPEKKNVAGGWQCNDVSIALRSNITVDRPKHIMHNWTFF